jgi:hypothetical protein
MKSEDCYGGCRVRLEAHSSKMADKQSAFGRHATIERTDGKDALVTEEVRGYQWWWPISALYALPEIQ